MIELMPSVSEAYTPGDWERLKKTVVSKKVELERDALRLATQLLGQKPKAFSKWVVTHWQDA
jgi:hypothetical protein